MIISISTWIMHMFFTFRCCNKRVFPLSLAAAAAATATVIVVAAVFHIAYKLQFDVMTFHHKKMEENILN